MYCKCLFKHVMECIITCITDTGCFTTHQRGRLDSTIIPKVRPNICVSLYAVTEGSWESVNYMHVLNIGQFPVMEKDTRLCSQQNYFKTYKCGLVTGH